MTCKESDNVRQMKMLLIEQNNKIIQLLKFAKDTKTNKLTSVGNVAKSINLIEQLKHTTC